MANINGHECYRFKVVSFTDVGPNRFFVATCEDCGKEHTWGELIEPRFEQDREYAAGYAHACGYHD